MTSPGVDPAAAYRHHVYTLLTLVAVGLVAGRLASTSTATIRANDRSRWCTVRALVHDGTYAIGQRTPLPGGGYRDEGIVTEPGWDTIDKVLDPGTNTFYSSKPPLFPTAVAGVYWVVRAVTGWSIAGDQLPVVWSVLAVVNLVPFALYCVLLARLVERFGRTDWGRFYVFAAGCLGTFVTTFQGVLNNHTPAAVAALASLYFVTGPGPVTRRQCVFAGFLAGVAAACDLPAASLLAGVAVWCWVRRGPAGGFAAATAAALPIAAWLATNALAVGQIRPAYAHEGSVWYFYAGSPWAGAGLDGIERAGAVEGKAEYALNLTLGHHGLFALTPVFALAVWGLSSPPGRDHTGGESVERQLTQIIRVTAGLTACVLVFYVARTSNYGGVGVGPRWFFWLTPLLLVASLRVADELSECRAGRLLGGCLLAASVASAGYRATDPWSHHPWLYDLMCYADPALRYPSR